MKATVMVCKGRNLVAALVATLVALASISDVRAQVAGTDRVPLGGSIDMSLPLFKSRVVSMQETTGRVAVGNPDVADIVVISPPQMYVLAKDIGTTNVLFWSRDNRLVGSINLEVAHDLEGLKEKLHKLLPDEPIEVHSAQRSIILRGRASNVLAMNAAVRVAEGYLAQVQTAKSSQQFEQESASRREDKEVGNPDIADIVVISPTQMYILAKDIGNTNLLFWARDGRLLGSVNLEVGWRCCSAGARGRRNTCRPWGAGA